MIGRPRVHHRLTDSTNERAKELAIAGAPHGTLVTAGEQTAGRGRQGRSWVAAPGDALLMSLLLRDLDDRSALLPLLAAVAVCGTLECEASVMRPVSIKWPNDVWIDGRKVAGILVEGRPHEGWAVLGIGLNVWTERDGFPADLRETATSVVLADGGAPDLDQILEALLGRLERWLNAEPASILSEWRKRDALYGKSVGWEGGAGVAAGIDDSGALRVDTRDGPVALDAGEVHLRSVSGG